MRIYFCRVLQLTAGSISTTVHVSSFSFYLLLVRLLPGAARFDPQHGMRAHEWHGQIQSAPASETSECESMSVLDGNAKGGAAGQRRCSTKFSIHLMRTAPQKYCERLPNWHENIDDDAHSIDSDSGKRWWWQRRGKWIMICIWGYEIRYSRYTRTGEYNVTIKFILPKYRWTKKKKYNAMNRQEKGKKNWWHCDEALAVMSSPKWRAERWILNWIAANSDVCSLLMQYEWKADAHACSFAYTTKPGRHPRTIFIILWSRVSYFSLSSHKCAWAHNVCSHLRCII